MFGFSHDIYPIVVVHVTLRIRNYCFLTFLAYMPFPIQTLPIDARILLKRFGVYAGIIHPSNSIHPYIAHFAKEHLKRIKDLFSRQVEISIAD